MRKAKRRSRYVRPDLFMDEELAECSFEARYFFVGLFCYADREGRLEFRAKRLKAHIFPYDPADLDELVAELAGAGKLLRYSAKGFDFDIIEIKNFATHQNIHPGEPASALPAPPQRTSRRRKASAAAEGPASAPSGPQEPPKVPPSASGGKKAGRVAAPGERKAKRPAPKPSPSGAAAAAVSHDKTRQNITSRDQSRSYSYFYPYPYSYHYPNHNPYPNGTATKAAAAPGKPKPEGMDLLRFKLRFGKEHRGKIIGDVPPDYAKWMLNAARYKGKLDGTTRLALMERVKVKAEECRR